MALYQTYRCVGSSIKATLANDASATVDFCILPSISGTNPGAPAQYFGQKYAKVLMVAQYDAGKSIQTMKKYMSTATLYGVSKKEVRDEDNYSGTATSNPANQWFWHLTVESVNGTTNCTGVLHVQMNFYVALGALVTSL